MRGIAELRGVGTTRGMEFAANYELVHLTGANRGLQVR
jgi:hypothetical protein